MIKKILTGVVVLSVIGAATVYYLTRPSENIDKYKSDFVDDNNKPLDSGVRVTFFGTSNLLIDDGTTQLMIDGFFSRPPMTKTLSGEISTDSILVDRYLNDYKINNLKGLFVTHSHYDHAFDCGYVAKKTGATLYGSSSTLNIGRGADVPESQMQEYQLNKDLTFGNFTVRAVPSKHSPGDGKLDGEIKEPLRQPAKYNTYLEGGAYDFLVTYKGKKIYIKPSPNFIPGALDSLNVDVLFTGIATITKKEGTFAEDFYREVVTALEPSILIPLHWDDFFEPLSDHLPALPKAMADVGHDFDFVSERAKRDGIGFKILQGTKSIVLF
jgi:L-ascorbate metabolism protein UlaG (beta-lactamase superfamily)